MWEMLHGTGVDSWCVFNTLWDSWGPWWWWEKLVRDHYRCTHGSPCQVWSADTCKIFLYSRSTIFFFRFTSLARSRVRLSCPIVSSKSVARRFLDCIYSIACRLSYKSIIPINNGSKVFHLAKETRVVLISQNQSMIYLISLRAADFDDESLWAIVCCNRCRKLAIGALIIGITVGIAVELLKEPVVLPMQFLIE